MGAAVQQPATSIAPATVSVACTANPEESLRVAILLSCTGGFLDAFTWIAHHGVMANAQTANVVLLAVFAAMGEWEKALRYIPPIVAFMVGVFIVCWLRAKVGERGSRRLAMTTLTIEIAVLLAVMVLHVRLPNVAGTLGISFAAAMQTASFTKVEGRNYSSVMVTGSLRYSTEMLFAGWFAKHDPVALRHAKLLLIACLAFALGAGIGALLTLDFGSRALLVPIALLSMTYVLCRYPAAQAAHRAL